MVQLLKLTETEFLLCSDCMTAELHSL